MKFKTWSNLIGWNREDQIVKEEIPVEESECFQMVHLKRCDLARRSESCRFTK